MKKKDIYEMLIKVLDSTNIYVDEDMKKHTSFKIGGPAEFFVKANNIEQIKAVLQIAKNNNIPLKVFGNGTNILVKDKGIKGIVLKINLNDMQIQTEQKIQQLDKIAEEQVSYNKKVLVTVEAGVSLGMLAQKLMKLNISGFEFASGIPGTIGGAITMNAGAYGNEFKDIVVQTKYMDTEGNIYTINNTQHEFEYRNSIFKKNNFIILETVLELQQLNDNESIKNKMQDLLNQRKEKQTTTPSAGSTFKRGTDYITAKLIDECNLKGYTIGGAKVSEKHAGFIVNTGNATAEDVLKLIEYVKQTVKQKFNKNLELEIEIIGE